MRILVLGAGGQLGQAMIQRLSGTHEVIGRVRSEVDVARIRDVERTVRAVRPSAIVNCAAYTNVNDAEDRPAEALEANAWGPRALARAAAEAEATLVHFSTEFVFNGDTASPYTEHDVPHPMGVYAMSKLLGEWFALEAPGAYVLRVESLFGGRRAKSSVDLLLNAVLEGREARPFVDRVVSPSYVDDVADATLALLDRRAPAGLYHCVNSGHTTWLELTRELARLAGRPNAPMTPMYMRDAHLRPPRPYYAAMSNAKLAGVGITMPTWQDALRRYVGTRLAAPPGPP